MKERDKRENAKERHINVQEKQDRKSKRKPKERITVR